MPDLSSDDCQPWRVEHTTPLPTSWTRVVEELTHLHSVRDWGNAADAFGKHYRQLRSGVATFRVSLQALVRNTRGLAEEFPCKLGSDERTQATAGFGIHVADVWRAVGTNRWRECHAYTLRTGPLFHSQSAAKRAAIHAPVVRAEAPA